MIESREELLCELLQYFEADGFPDPVPLNLKILSKRTFLDYEEWKIEYDVESAETMPVEPGWRVPAYLLIPRHSNRPHPAVICFHQCAEDCVIGKEAVVGKVPWVSTRDPATFFDADGRVSLDRSDQAYGYELVHEGFVVLAPDSINCGERNIDAIRKPGEVRICHRIIDPLLGKEADFKRVIDGIRAIDVLESLDFVDSQRIGAVGHSMGAGGVYWLMAFDERIKAGILGTGPVCARDGIFVELIAPRLLMCLWGAFDGEGGLEEQRARHKASEVAQGCYGNHGVPENLIIRKLDCGHRFADEFKWEAYKRLKEYFGILPERTQVSLAAIANEAWRATAGFLREGLHVRFLGVSGKDYMILANRKQILSAIAGLYLYLSDRSLGISLAVTIDANSERPCISCVCSSETPIPEQPTLADFESLRGVGQILAEHEAKLNWEHSGRDLVCSVIFPKS